MLHEIMKKMARSQPSTDVTSIITTQDVKKMRELADEIYMDEKIEEYIVNIVEATRKPEEYNIPIQDLIRYGASPRATIAPGFVRRVRRSW